MKYFAFYIIGFSSQLVAGFVSDQQKESSQLTILELAQCRAILMSRQLQQRLQWSDGWRMGL
jgi:hypothetical protein